MKSDFFCKNAEGNTMFSCQEKQKESNLTVQRE